MNQFSRVILLAAIALSSALAEAKTFRATEVDSSKWAMLTSGQMTDIIIEFREGDELPVSFLAEGYLFSTTHTATSYIGIKKNFWLKFSEGSSTMLMSLDGNEFKPFNQVITGSLTAGAGNETNHGVANNIQINLKAFIKN